MEYREYRSEEVFERRPGDGSVRARSTRDLLDEFVGQGQRLLREEVRLAKAELRDEARSAAKGGALVGAAGALGFVGLIVFAFALVWLFALVLPLWAAALVVTALLGLVAAGLGLAGRSKLKQAAPVAGETRETLEEDRRWARGTMREARSRTRANA